MPFHRAMLLILAGLAAPVAALAQSPVVTETGDPSVDPDSIYARAVDPADYVGHHVVLLLDDAIARVEADGQTSNTIRQVVQVLTKDGAADWGEFTFQYRGEHQRFRLNWVRVLRPDGTVLSEGPEHRQESSPSVNERSPMYTDRRIVRMTVGGVAPGTIVDYSYTIETFDPRLPGDVWYDFFVNATVPVFYSRFILDVPEDLTVRLRELNIDTSPYERVENGRNVRVWASRDVPAVELQTYWGSPNKVFKAIGFSGDVTWDQIGNWYYALLRDRYVLSPEIEAQHAAQLAGARTLRDSLRATYRWVAQDFRYVSLSLGDGAYQPRTPLELMASGFGDCKDKATFFVTLARRMGLEAYPVLVSTEGGVDSLAPSLKQFDHMIARIEGPDEPQYFDLTTTLTPFGELPMSLQGEVGVVMRDGRETEVVVLPADPLEANLWEGRIVGSVGRDNKFTGSVTFTGSGSRQYGLRSDFSNYDQLRPEDRDELIRSYLSSTAWEGATVDSSHAFQGQDLTAPARLTIWFTVEGILGAVGGRYLLNLPTVGFGDPSMVTQLQSEGERKFPIDVEAVNDASIVRSRFDVELPEGWRAELHPDVSARGAFGYYLADYRQVGRTVTVLREMGGRRGIEPPDSIDALLAWLRAVAEDDAHALTLDRNGSPGLIAPDANTEVGRLPDVLLKVEDLPGGVKLFDEGPGSSANFFAEFGSGDVLEAFSRSFAAEQMVFKVDSSRLAMLGVNAEVFNSNVEAVKGLQLIRMLDMRTLFQAISGQMGLGQVTMGEVREIDLSAITEHGAGWILEMVTPFATLDVAISLLTRGRVTLSAVAVGASGMRGEDLVRLLGIMDERVKDDPHYLTDTDPSTWTTKEPAADLAVAETVGVPLDEVLLRPADLPGSRVYTQTLAHEDGVHVYSRGLDGRAFTFTTGSSDAVSVEMEIAQYENEARALKSLMGYEDLDFSQFMMTNLFDGVGGLDQADAALMGALRSSESSLEQITGPTVGTRSVQWLARLRAGLLSEVDAVHFLRGRYVVSVTVTNQPGQSSPEDALSLARRIDQKLMMVVPELAAASPPRQDLVETVRTVVVAEAEVDSLASIAHDFNAMFQVIERANLAEAPVTFGPSTWNSVCWYGAIYGHAERVLDACDRAVAPDSTILSRLDSRAVARALTGDIDGAMADFRYIVENAAEGEFLETRAGWLAALASGVNPFTEEELARLRGTQ